MKDTGYAQRVAEEQSRFKREYAVHELPDIFHYWSARYLVPLLQQLGIP
jgi:hypothetical protein